MTNIEIFVHVFFVCAGLSPEQNAAHTGVAHEDDEEKNEEVEQVAGSFLDGTRDQAHALL